MRWVLVLMLAVVATATPAEAQSADATTQAYNTAQALERQVGQLGTRRSGLWTRWQDELHTVDRLKNSPRSWRRDSELRDALSEADGVGKQLEGVTGELAKAQSQLAAARRALVAAIDRELAANPSVPRRAQLDKARAQVAPQSRKAHRIVLPDMQIDPLADPEELDQQATAFRESESELQAQIKGLESQASELERVAILRKQHERTKEMDSREDNSSRKNTTSSGQGGRGSTETLNDSPAPPADAGSPMPSTGGSFESDATVTLSDVVDTSTIDSLRSAQRSGDPGKRAAAAKQARDAVAKKLDQLRIKRKQIEDRARTLRTKH
ncbi:MAG: hypothetical protein ABI867_04590 [Kofleriaceae bacterium]